MPTFEVILTRDLTESCLMLVEADTEFEAREAAYARYPEYPYVSSVEEALDD